MTEYYEGSRLVAYTSAVRLWNDSEVEFLSVFCASYRGVTNKFEYVHRKRTNKGILLNNKFIPPKGDDSEKNYQRFLDLVSSAEGRVREALGEEDLHLHIVEWSDQAFSEVGRWHGDIPEDFCKNWFSVMVAIDDLHENRNGGTYVMVDGDAKLLECNSGEWYAFRADHQHRSGKSDSTRRNRRVILMTFTDASVLNRSHKNSELYRAALTREKNRCAEGYVSKRRIELQQLQATRRVLRPRTTLT